MIRPTKIRDEIFTYAWHVDEKEKDVTIIRAYGLNKLEESVCLIIEGFTPFAYIELPKLNNGNLWTAGKAKAVGSSIDKLLGECRPLSKRLTFKKKLYGAHINTDGEREEFPYLFCKFSCRADIRKLEYKLKYPIHCSGCGKITLKMHESDADQILQFTCHRGISTAGWCEFVGKEIVDDTKLTLCAHEYKVKCNNVKPFESDVFPRPLIMGFDIEVNSDNPSAMPNKDKPADCVFQISCVLSRSGDSPDTYRKYLLTLGDPDQQMTGNDITIITFPCESALIEGFAEFIQIHNPNVISGYNILGFDIPYLIGRSKHTGARDFGKQGFPKNRMSAERTIKWSSAAYGTQEFEFLDAEGRVFVDLLPLVKRDYKFNNYKLKTISEHFIGETKDPLSVKGIFKCYRIGSKKEEDGTYSNKARKAMAIVGKYCVQDSALVNQLMDKLQTWIGLTEMANTCRVPIFTLYTQGQQIKVFSQLYKYCMDNNIVVEKNGYEVKADERYVGAHVFPPVPGQYQNVIPFDFASLYPTTIIAYNIDYHTWVPDGVDVPDSKCHVMKWEDHIGCEHDPKVIRYNELTAYIEMRRAELKRLRSKRDRLSKTGRAHIVANIAQVMEDLKPYTKERSDLATSRPKVPMCAKRSYRFLKEPKGVLPTIIQNLLDARAHTRKVDIVACKKEMKNATPERVIELQTKISVLNKRQLAYKVSANSMYGAMGVRRGYLPFMPGAMCTTYMGRVNIEIVAKTIVSEYDGELVYGDTDSNYIYFPKMKDRTTTELWDHAEFVAAEVTKRFPDPIKLEFEEAIYTFFFILTKKRYMYREIGSRDGEADSKIGRKGVLLARRDNSKFVRDVYEMVIASIADGVPRDDILYAVLERINNMFAGCLPVSDFVITKAVGDYGGLTPNTVYEEGKKKTLIGDYTVPNLSSDPEEHANQLHTKRAQNEEEFYLFSLPAQVQLAHRMKSRGVRVDTGTRLEYVVTDPYRHTAKQYEKVEDADYFSKFRSALTIDGYYYLKALTTPLDQVFNVAFKDTEKWVPDFVIRQYNFRYKQRFKLLNELMSHSRPTITFI